MKKISVILAALLSVSMILVSCGKNETEENSAKKATPEATMSSELKKLTKNTIDAVIELENGDEINLELYPDLAPKTVENFIKLAEDGFYDGTIFHRVIEGFVIQGGGYDEDLNSLKTKPIKGEFTSNGFDNELLHTRGVISMARTSDPDSASSQFFIVQQAAPNLDGEYAGFGKVKDDDSLEVIDDIASVKTGSVSSVNLDDVPITPIIIKTVKIDSGDSSSDSTKKDSSKSKSGKNDDDMTDSKTESGSDNDKDNMNNATGKPVGLNGLS